MEQPYMITGIILSLVFFLCTVSIMSRRSVAQPKTLPPEVVGAWPVIGHLHLLNAREPTHITLAKMADAYGPIFTFRFGRKRALIVSNWEIAKECFTTNDRIFASRPKLFASKLLAYNYAMIGFSAYNPHWRYVRKIATIGLIRNHHMDQLQNIRELEVRNWMKKLHDFCWLQNNKRSEKVFVDMKKWFEDIIFNIIFKMVIGKRFATAFDDPVCREKCRKALNDFLELFGRFIPSDSFSFLSWLDLGRHEKAMKNTAQILDETLHKFLQQHGERRDCNKGKIEEQDFMDAVISTVENDDGENLSYNADTIIKATCLNMIVGGFDTTTVTITWALSLLLNNEETLRKAQLEIDEQIGREREVKQSDIKNLLYLNAIVKETLRLHPPGPLLVPHESIEDCTIAGYHIPKGTRLIVNAQKLHKDPLVWEDPCEFRAERFLTSENNNVDVRGKSPQLIPFGNGRRICPAISFALQMLHLTLANFLHGFKIERPSEALLDMEESSGLTSCRKAPLEVVLTPRLPAKVYE